MDIAKLKKQLAKADAAVEEARGEMDRAIDAFANAFASRAVIKDRLAYAEALEAANALRDT